MVEARLIAGLAHRELGDQRAANQAAERALALAEADRLVLPFAMTGSRELLEALPGTRQRTPRCWPTSSVSRKAHPRRPDGSPERRRRGSSARVSYRCSGICPMNLSRPQIAGELSVSANTVSTHLRSIYAKLQVRDRSAAVQRARQLRLLAAGRAR